MDKRILIVFAICISFCNDTAFGQEITWQKMFGTNLQDFFNAICKDSSGNYILGINATSSINGDKIVSGYGSQDFWIVKTDQFGNFIWQKDFGGSTYDKIEKIETANDGSIYLLGTSDSPISGVKTTPNYGQYDYWLVKLDSNGNYLWDRTLGGGDQEEALVLEPSIDGGCYIGGYTFSDISGNKSDANFGLNDGWMLKIDKNGIIIWSKELGTASWDYLFDIIELSDKSILCGLTAGSGVSGNKTLPGNGPDFWLVKLDSTGTILDQHVYGGSGSEGIEKMVLTPDNGLICAGSTNSPKSFDKSEGGYGSWDIWIVKLDSMNNIVWDRTIGGDLNEYFKGLDILPNGDVVIGMYSASSLSGIKPEGSKGWDDVWLTCLDSTGNIKWQNVIGGDQHDRLLAIESSKDGNVVCGGYTWSSHSEDVTDTVKGYCDAWFIKVECSQYGLASGKVYADLNQNEIQDSAEFNVAYQKLSIFNSNRVLFTNKFGRYNLHLATNDTLEYGPVLGSSVYFPTPPSYSISNPAPSLIDSSNHFSLTPLQYGDDLIITISPITRFRPGFNASYRIDYMNIGTTDITPTLMFRLFPGVVFNSAFPIPSQILTDSVIWNLSTVSPMQRGSIYITVSVSPTLTLGSILNSYVQIRPLDFDITPYNNNATWEVIITGSADPNDIIVNIDTIYSNWINNPPFLEYLIRFQNTGTDTAFNVVILNPIDTNKLDLSTLEYISSSNNLDMEFIYHERNLRFEFENILLPDSNINEPASHGFVRYKIKPKSNLIVGDTIKNYAAIYFDFNSPVITNRAETYLVSLTMQNELSIVPGLTVYPNPVADILVLAGLSSSHSNRRIWITDLAGKIVYNHILNNSSDVEKLNVGKLEAGFYCLSVESLEGRWVAKFLKE